MVNGGDVHGISSLPTKITVVLPSAIWYDLVTSYSSPSAILLWNGRPSLIAV